MRDSSLEIIAYAANSFSDKSMHYSYRSWNYRILVLSTINNFAPKHPSVWIISVTLRYRIALNKNIFPIFFVPFMRTHIRSALQFAIVYFEKDTNYISRMH